MAIIQISKIQQRSGNIVDLPQLDEAEFGWATDVKRLYIGKTTPNENIEVLTSYSNISFSQINGSFGNLAIDGANLENGQPLTYTGTEWTNRGGNLGGLINLGDVSNVKIGGGAISYVLETDGTGNLTWAPKSTIIAFIQNATKANPGVITTTEDNYFVDGSQITITNVPGMTQLNGNTYYANVINSNSFSLYSDSGLTTPVNTSAFSTFPYTSVTATSASTNRITVGSSTAFSINDPVIFIGTTFGGIVEGTTYYVLTKPTGTTLTISETVGGSIFALTTDTGSCNVYVPGGRLVSLVSSTGGSGTGVAGGTNTMVQFNNVNVLDGSSDFTFDFGASPKVLSLNGNANISNLNSNGTVNSTRFISNISTGTAPLQVISTTRVANLNVDRANVSDFNAVTLQTTGTFFPVFVNGSASANRALSSNANISFNVATGNLVTNIFTANGNIAAGGNITATANITAGNNITATSGNITASNGIVNSRGLTITGTFTGNANVSTVTSGIGIKTISSTYTDNVIATNGTLANAAIHAIGTPTIATANANTFITNISTLYIQGAPLKGTNVNTITNSYALYIDSGDSYLGGSTTVTGTSVVGRFVQSPYSIVAPNRRINVGSGSLTSITTAISTGTNPIILAIDPSGRFVYSTNYAANTLSIFSINQITGVLTSVGTIATGTSPQGIACDPTGRFVYVTNYGADTVSQYSINQTTGALTLIGTAATGSFPYRVACDPTGRFVYVTNFVGNSVSQYSINQSTGALTSITTAIAAGTNPYGVACDPTGRFVYVANSALVSSSISQYSINQTTGALTQITTAISVGARPSSISVDPTGRFVYATSYYSGTVSQFSINQTTGALTSITTAISSGSLIREVACDPTGYFVYVSNGTSNTISQFSINQSTGALTTITTAIAAGSDAFGIAVDPTGRFVYVNGSTANSISQYYINNFSPSQITTTTITTGANTIAGAITGNWSLTAGSRLNATYADLAEYYVADQDYEPGTVLEFGGTNEVTIATDGTNKVAGVVSSNPAYIMNSDCAGEYKVAIALQGRVPTKVTGNIKKGDMIISAGNGYGTACNSPVLGTVIGKSLENYEGIDGVIEIAIGRL